MFTFLLVAAAVFVADVLLVVILATARPTRERKNR